MIAAWCVVFYGTSIGAGILNKLAVSQGVDPTVLSASHLFVAVVLDGTFIFPLFPLIPPFISAHCSLTTAGSSSATGHPSPVTPPHLACVSVVILSSMALLVPDRSVQPAQPAAEVRHLTSPPVQGQQFEGDAARPPPPRQRLSRLSLAHWTSTLQAFWPVSLCMVLGKLSTYASYVTMSVSLTQTAKALEPLFNVTLAFLCFGERKPARLVVTLVPIAFGVALATTGESTFNGVGFLFALASGAFKVLQNITLKRVMDKQYFSFFETHLYGALSGLLLLLPFLMFDVVMATEPLLHR